MEAPPPAPVNLSHSPLLQQIGHTTEDPAHKELVEARRKFSSIMENDLLDYLHYHPSTLQVCIETLLKIFENVLENPGDQRFRKIKDNSGAFQHKVANVKHADRLMLQAGWRPQVVDMQKHWVFDAEEGSMRFRVLAECRAVLQQTQAMIAEKAQRKQREEEERRNKGQAERDRIRLQIEEDRNTRAVMNELKLHHQPAVSHWDPSGGSKDRQRQDCEGAGVGGAGRLGHATEPADEEEEEEEEEAR